MKLRFLQVTARPLHFCAVVVLSVIAIYFMVAPGKKGIREQYEVLLTGMLSDHSVEITRGFSGEKPDQPEKAAIQDFYMTLDPNLGYVPADRLYSAYKQIRQMYAPVKDDGLQWTGTSADMGGRTRAIMWDPNDPSYKKVWAGGVTGGLWYRNDITNNNSQWSPVSDLWENITISCITFDPVNPQIFYAGTGEAQTALTIYRESTGVGVGILKSEDGGFSWEIINTTYGFRYITDIVVRNENGTSVIYAGVVSGVYQGQTHQSDPTDGLYRSADGGETWEQVLPDIPGTETPYAVSDIELGADNKLYVGTMQNVDIQGGATIFHTNDGTYGSWTEYADYRYLILSQPTYKYPARVMLSASPSHENVIYAAIAAGYDNGFIYYRGRYIIKSTNKGESWTQIQIPENTWSTLAWHAFIIRVDPVNPNRLFTGGLDLWLSSNSGSSWNHISDWSLMYYGGGDDYVHADQHNIAYRPGSATDILFACDGGLFYTQNGNTNNPVFQEKNQGFNTLQFYTADIHPTAGEEYYVGGLQDNGTLLYEGSPLSINDMIDGGDGAFCFIDQNQGNLMITSVYYNQYTIHLNSQPYNYIDIDQSGIFINPADYDNNLNILYANAVDYFGSNQDLLLKITGIPDNPTESYIDMGSNSNIWFSNVKVSPHSTTSSKLFVGSASGRLFKVNNAQSAIPQVYEIGSPDFPTANLSSISIGGSDDTLLVTFSNYGVSSVWQTYDGGLSWTEKEGNLPDIPVRWCQYHPQNSQQALVATDLGVWSTQNLDENPPIWTPENNGLAHVRVDMLNIRTSDNTVIAATHGRGLYTAPYPLNINTNIVEKENTSVTVFPNPTSGKVNWKVNPSMTDCRLTLMDNAGRTIINESYVNGKDGNGTNTLDLSGYSKGAYYLTVTAGQKRSVQKILLR